jgi:hypothetical protein
MSNEDAKSIMRTKDFGSFFDRTSRIIERALDGGDQFDVTKTYFMDKDEH